MVKQRVVVTGMGMVGPGAGNLAEFRQQLKAGSSGIAFNQEMADAGFECMIAGRATGDVDHTDPLIRYFEIQDANEYIRMACRAALEAWQDAGLPIPDPQQDEVDYNTGVVIGGIMPGLEIVANKIMPMVNAQKTRKLGSQIIHNTMPSGAAAFISGIFAAGNHSISMNSACSTGADNILSGYYSISTGSVQRMIVGASDPFSVYALAGFDAMRVLNKLSNDRPEQGSRPMSEQAHGFVPGSGAGVLILENLETALERGATIYAEIIGGAVNCGAMRCGGSMTFPNRHAVVRCLRQAIDTAGIQPEDIDYINGHLSGTVADKLEVANWVEALGRKGKDFPYINSTKSLIGHCLGAAGALEFIATVLQMESGFLHPSLNTEDLHPEIAAMIHRDCVPLQTVAPPIRVAAKASFGFGDVNSALIIKKWEG